MPQFVRSFDSFHPCCPHLRQQFLCVMCCWDQDCLPGELCGHLRKRNAVKPFNHLYTKGSRGRQGPALLFVMLGPGRRKHRILDESNVYVGATRTVRIPPSCLSRREKGAIRINGGLNQRKQLNCCSSGFQIVYHDGLRCLAGSDGPCGVCCCREPLGDLAQCHCGQAFPR